MEEALKNGNIAKVLDAFIEVIHSNEFYELYASK